MKGYASIGERYCPAKGQNVPVEIWWDSNGNRQENCLHHPDCSHQTNSLISPCSAPGQIE